MKQTIPHAMPKLLALLIITISSAAVGFAKASQDIVRSRGSNGRYTNAGRPEFFPWQASPLSPMQFIGTYRYDGYSKGQSIYNIATDSKSVTSLGYHMPFLRNHRRSQQKEFGNTYQFYLWSSPR